jgi:hypothetical protein
MITTDIQDGQLTVTVFGEFTLADFQEFESIVLSAEQRPAAPDLLFDLREMAGFTLDMAWEEIRFSREHGDEFKRIAVVTDSEWVTWSAWLEQLFVTADLRVFADPAEARAWLA